MLQYAPPASQDQSTTRYQAPPQNPQNICCSMTGSWFSLAVYFHSGGQNSCVSSRYSRKYQGHSAFTSSVFLDKTCSSDVNLTSGTSASVSCAGKKPVGQSGTFTARGRVLQESCIRPSQHPTTQVFNRLTPSDGWLENTCRPL